MTKDADLITNGSVVRWIPTGIVGVVKRAGSRSSKVEFVIKATGVTATRQVKNSQLSRKAARL